MNLVIHSSKVLLKTNCNWRSCRSCSKCNWNIDNYKSRHWIYSSRWRWQFNNVNLITVSGTGANATADITIRDGVAIAATITSGGNGYQVGDVVTVGTIGVASVGRNVRFTIAGIGVTTQLILDNVQGDFIVGAAGTIKFFNSSGISTELNGQTAGGDVTIPSDGITEVSDGLHIKINHKNHGMNFDDNIVRISGVRPDVKPTKLAVAYDKASSDPISVIDATVPLITLKELELVQQILDFF